jgi:hypothetical protein
MIEVVVPLGAPSQFAPQAAASAASLTAPVSGPAADHHTPLVATGFSTFGTISTSGAPHRDVLMCVVQVCCAGEAAGQWIEVGIGTVIVG